MEPAEVGHGRPLEVPIRILAYGVELPEYARPGDGACDLRSEAYIEIPPLSRALVPTGFSLEIPDGYAGMVIPRSGLAINFGITCLNSPGLIDSGYRGEVKVILYNSDATETFRVNKGDRIAQLVIVATPRISFVRTDKLSETARGAGGFGHTGIGDKS
ncbi:MAG: dUTP diphosphatase [Actinomycetota bacterium]|jgi:dUTP pyrophosphatase|nr:dUTP diphosphatase [Actinomycetota bacterium]